MCARVISLTIGICALVALAWSAPDIYNHYLNPLARLKNSIDVGDSYPSIEQKFARFRLLRPRSTFTRDRTVHHLLKGPVPAAQQLFLYHESALGAAYLQVLFDRELRVSEVSYLLD